MRRPPGGQFTVVIADTDAGSIGPHQTIDVAGEPGHHQLRLSAWRYSSRTQPFDVADDEVIPVSCHGATMWPRYVASLLKPGLAIALRRD